MESNGETKPIPASKPMISHNQFMNVTCEMAQGILARGEAMLNSEYTHWLSSMPAAIAEGPNCPSLHDYVAIQACRTAEALFLCINKEIAPPPAPPKDPEAEEKEEPAEEE